MVATHKFRTILLFGMPGSGKGTQGVVLGHLPGVIHISSGDLFRKLPKHGELGREVVSYTTRGLLVPDDLTIRIWKRYVQILTLQEEIYPGCTTLVLDGLPRNHAQAKMLDDMLEVIQIFHLRITDMEQARDRLAARALRENRLDDINEEVVNRRLKVYEEETVQTLEFYDPSIIFEINASQTPLKVHTDIVSRLCKLETDRQHLSDPPDVALAAQQAAEAEAQRLASSR
jgi:adenylate kinase